LERKRLRMSTASNRLEEYKGEASPRGKNPRLRNISRKTQREVKEKRSVGGGKCPSSL